MVITKPVFDELRKRCRARWAKEAEKYAASIDLYLQYGQGLFYEEKKMTVVLERDEEKIPVWFEKGPNMEDLMAHLLEETRRVV